MLSPIGWVESSYLRRFGTPQQAHVGGLPPEEATLVLDPHRIPPTALDDLGGFERLWVISWLDRGNGWAPRVRPPRGARVPRGLFSTRSPDRPNPIGLSAVELLEIVGLRLRVRGIDLLDRTPILDLKPYVPYADAFERSRAGWLDEVPTDAPQLVKRPPRTP